MKKIFFILLTLIAFISYGQSPLTDVNGKVITSATGDILVQEADPNNFEYTPNAEWIPVNGVADGEIWILAFDGGTSRLFTITCTTSSGEWVMQIYGGADGKQLLRTYDTTSNVALSHTLVSGTGKYSYTSGYYTYKIVIKPKNVGANILTFMSNVNNKPFLISNFGTKNLTSLEQGFMQSENLIYSNIYYCNKITTLRLAYQYCTNLVKITFSESMPYLTTLANCFQGCSANLTLLQLPLYTPNLSDMSNFYKDASGVPIDIIMPKSMPNLTTLASFINQNASKLETWILPESMTVITVINNIVGLTGLKTITTCTFSNNIINFSITRLRELTTFSQPTLRASTFTLTGTYNEDRSNINYIQIDWANSQFTGNVDIRYNNLSATELNRIFSELPTVVVSRTIYVASNVGSATCDPTIATAKNWIVITS